MTHAAGGPAPRRFLHRLSEPPVLFTGIAVLVLAVIWNTTLRLAAGEREAADSSAIALASDTAETYEAQAVRALREIDQTLKLVRYRLGTGDADAVLQDLRAEDLLPPEILFTISVADAAGEVIAGGHAQHGTGNIAQNDYFQQAGQTGELVVGQPEYVEETEEWLLHFSRALQGSDGRFAGIVMLSVHAGYFVSGYEPAVMGEQGVLGLVGTDGVFRARGTGEAVSAGETVDYGALVQDEFSETEVRVETSPWDGVERYIATRKLFEFPLAIVVGLAREEQLAPAGRLARTYMLRAAAVSVLLLAVLALLGWTSWQLHKTRERSAEERIAHAQRVEYLAYHDSLTDLPNRAFFSRLLTQGMQQASRYQRSLALLFLDLDRFKNINDSLGHDAGDELLQEIGRRLRASVRESDVVARLGGDEFMVLLPEVQSERQVTPVAEKILAAVGRPFTLVGQEFRITVSIGISLFPADGEDEQTLMKNADVAMYHAKELGKNNFQFYSEKLNKDSLERLALESSLRGALERDEFRLFYQAKREMAGGKVTGMEALLRWDHPDLGLISPMQFIPLAEETGLIVPIGLWVLRHACQQSVAWRQDGFEALSMAVNLSPRQFLDEHLLDDIRKVLKETGMDPRLLELEITESMLMHDMQQTLKILRALKDMGVRIAIDDFGTGYSSLSTLKEFPIDTVKIDGSFIHDIARSMEDRSLAQAVIAVGKSLGLTVIAEGVETADQADFLRSQACNEFQGFYINKPLPADEFAQLVREQRLGPYGNIKAI